VNAERQTAIARGGKGVEPLFVTANLGTSEDVLLERILQQSARDGLLWMVTDVITFGITELFMAHCESYCRRVYAVPFADLHEQMSINHDDTYVSLDNSEAIG
jgi:hypothetical protein